MENLIKNQKTVLISSLGEDNFPHISYAPFFMKDDKIYIYISKVADHYNNLEKNKKVSVMVIEDETGAQSMFGRQRVSFKGNAIKVSEVPKEVTDHFNQVHGNRMMEILGNMDFDFFEVSIINGRLVDGFAKAYDISYANGEWKKEHVVIDKQKNHA